MNYIVISPYYPKNFQNFSVHLKRNGVNVLGIGEEPYEQLDPPLREALTEYYRVNDMENVDEVKRAVAFLFHKHGPIDRIESHNEHWLELDAALRSQFNVFGEKTADIQKIKYKSEMEKHFRKAGVPVAQGVLLRTLEDVDIGIERLGLPVIAKPDLGVGAAATYQLHTPEDVARFKDTWDQKANYFMEEFIDGELTTYDGLIDSEGNIVFEASFTYQVPTLDLLEDDLDTMYYLEKEIDPKLKAYGQATVKAFGIKERFFHIEYFRMPDGDYKGLEYNSRPAGGYTIDMYNFANSINLYNEYARIVTGQGFEGTDAEPTYLIGISRRDYKNYVHTKEEIINRYGSQIRLFDRTPDAFASLLGDDFMAIEAATKEEVMEITEFIHAKY